MINDLSLRATLDRFYQQIHTIILSKQHPVTGLLPASTAVTVHGDYRDAWVRDNVYSILAVWGLALAYRQLDNDGGRGYELEQSCIKLMRGLLQAMMRQANKVEQFKQSLAPHDALHAKYNTETGGTVVADHAWGHLQVDATSLYLLMLAQMIASGLQIIGTQDEVNFIQNLVYYIERAYRTPDYGIWERGGKMNLGQVELNASSIGMAKAALEALTGFNLFGPRGSQASVLHVIPDNIAHADITLHAMLPRESSSKEVDAALLSVISFPAFAIQDEALVERVRRTIVEKLEGRYGLKRFLRDGHQTVLEDEHRLHYETAELRQFEHIESEWPLFFVYLYLDGLFRNDKAQIEYYEQKLATVLVEQDGQLLLPELYFVPADRVAAERARPHSQMRLPNANVPLVWAQSLYLLGQLVRQNLLRINDIDPLGRCFRKARREPVVQVALLAEDAALQAALAVHGVATETLQELAPIEVHYPETIAGAYQQVGRNRKLNLSGRPLRRIKSLTTSRLYQLAGRRVVCLSALFLQREFYLAYDLNFLADRFRSELAYIHRHWTQVGRPTVAVLLTHSLLEEGASAFFTLMQELRAGAVDEVPVKLGRLVQLMPTASFERIDLLHDFVLASAVLERTAARTPLLGQSGSHTPLHQESELTIEAEADWEELCARLAWSQNLYEQVEILATLVRRWGIEQTLQLRDKTVAIRELLEEVYAEAGRRRLWAVVRRASALLGKVDFDLDYAVSAILVCQKHILVGRAFSTDSLITQPLPTQELLLKINTFCRDDIRDSALTQELLIYLGLLIKARPDLFADLLVVRVSYLIVLLTSALAHERQLTQDEAYEQLMHLAPSDLQQRLMQVLAQYQGMQAILAELESLHVESGRAALQWSPDRALEALPTPPQGWHAWRQYQGILSRASSDFYSQVWQLCQYCRGLVIGDKFERRNRLESAMVLSDMTPGEAAFALRVEHLLGKISAPEYRQLNLEALTVLARITAQNATLQVDDYIVLDVLIGHAVRLAHLHRYPEHEASYSEHKAAAWDAFYALPPISSTDYLARAFRYLLDFGPGDEG
ncbi:MAG: hypothetical protein KF832_21075 [Caldilineaceae bacterium]|nr:hypothetical protein [Caldilineaceae bacterium]